MQVAYHVFTILLQLASNLSNKKKIYQNTLPSNGTFYRPMIVGSSSMAYWSSGAFSFFLLREHTPKAMAAAACEQGSSLYNFSAELGVFRKRQPMNKGDLCIISVWGCLENTFFFYKSYYITGSGIGWDNSEKWGGWGYSNSRISKGYSRTGSGKEGHFRKIWSTVTYKLLKIRLK